VAVTRTKGVSSLGGVKVRPRLLFGSLLIADAVIAVFVWVHQSENSGDGNRLDARLTDPGAVVTFPNAGLANAYVQGDRLPDAVMLDFDGDEVVTADLIGEPLIVNLWNSTCAPSAKELPDFAQVDSETNDVRFVGVNHLDSVEVMERFARERGVEYDLYYDGLAEFTDGIGALALPIPVFVTSDGTIFEKTGPLDADELRAKIADLVAADQGVP